MAGVPDETVLREVEGQMQGETQLDDAEVAGEVGRTDAEDAHQFLTHLVGQLEQLGVVEFMQVRGGLDRRQ